MNHLITGMALLLATTSAVAAQGYPERPVTLLVPFAAGGPTDTVARLTAQAMSKALGQEILVENATGAGGTIASERAARSEADGYTILIHHIGMSTAPTLYRQLAYDPLTDLAPIGLVSEAPMTLIARPDFPADTLEELVEAMRTEGEALLYGNAGIGAASHLCGMLLMSATGAQVTTVPYQGNGPIMTDLMGSQIDMTCDQATNTVGPIETGAVKGYAVAAPERIETLPDLPTADEAGLPGFELSVWHGLYAPAGTPDDVVAELTSALQAAMEDESLQESFAAISTVAVSPEQATPEALSERLGSEIERWKPLIEEAGEFAD